MSQIQSALHTCDSCRQPTPICGGVNHGRMLMSFEGWQFTLEIYDRSKGI